MRVFIKNKAHPSMALLYRDITKKEWKGIWGIWRRGQCMDLFIGEDSYYICDWVEKDREAIDPLIAKSYALAVRIEQSQMGAVA